MVREAPARPDLTPASGADGWHTIVPFLRPIEHLIFADDVSEILVNPGPGGPAVYVERAGQLERVDAVLTEAQVYAAVKSIARRLGDDISDRAPILDSRLADGSRVAAVLSPCSVGGTALAIRKFDSRHYDLAELVRRGSLTDELAALLRRQVEGRANLLISGGTSSGKTTLLDALARLVPAEERLVVVEDTAEIRLSRPSMVRLEARRESGGVPAVGLRELLRATLRLRPDRIIVGEVRGAEAFDLLQALNTGHSGTLSTLHSNSAAHALQRMTSCVLPAGVELPYRALRAQLADCLDLLVHVERRGGRRRVAQVARVNGYDPDLDRYQLETIYEAEAPRA